MSGPSGIAPFDTSPFDPSDTWLLQAVLYAGGLTEGAELADVIGLGDGIRDALFSGEELRGGFARLASLSAASARAGIRASPAEGGESLTRSRYAPSLPLSAGGRR